MMIHPNMFLSAFDSERWMAIRLHIKQILRNDPNLDARWFTVNVLICKFDDKLQKTSPVRSSLWH